MKRLALVLSLLIAVAGGVVLMAGPGAQASPDATITDAAGNTSEFSARLTLPVGGIAELPQVSGSAGRNYAALAGVLTAVALVALTAGARYGRRQVAEVGRLKGWLLIETLLVLLVANAIVWFVIAEGWP